MFSKRVPRVCGHLFAKFLATDSAGAAATALFDFHVEKGGKMVNFGGFLLPVQYADQSITNSHLFTRRSASLFDVSHMLQTEITGKDCIRYLEALCTADLVGLSPNAAVLTVFTDEKGGVLDDLIITKIADDHLYVVSNAGRKDHDQSHLTKALEDHKRKNPKTNIKLRFFTPKERALLALQGPKAAEALQKLTNVDLSKLFFMNSTIASVCGVEMCRVTRCGYTGEDGFEISFPANKSVDLANEILGDENVKLAGLGARDTLRLEAGLCLYGNDLTVEQTPIEAGLTWTIQKRRRELRDFPGAESVLQQIKSGPKIKRVGLVETTQGPPARQGTVVLDESGGKQLGVVTSGCPSPSLGKNIAMAYVPAEHSKVGTNVRLKIRDRIYEAIVTKMPFVDTRYYTKPK